MIHKFRPVAVALTLAGGVLLAGCASSPSGAGARGTSLENRVDGRWAAVLGADYSTAHSYFSPSIQDATDVDSYTHRQRARTVKWIGAERNGQMECDEAGTSCAVGIAVTYEVSRGLPGLKKPVQSTRNITERWLQQDGAWYFVPDKLR